MRFAEWHARLAPPCRPNRHRWLWALGLAAPLLFVWLIPHLWWLALALYFLGVTLAYTHPVCRTLHLNHHPAEDTE